MEGEHIVQLVDLEFDPPNLTVEVGDQVTWVWQDGTVEHNVVADGFASELKSDGTFSYLFNEAGTYTYVCTIHPGMGGTIVVAND